MMLNKRYNDAKRKIELISGFIGRVYTKNSDENVVKEKRARILFGSLIRLYPKKTTVEDKIDIGLEKNNLYTKA